MSNKVLNKELDIIERVAKSKWLAEFDIPDYKGVENKEFTIRDHFNGLILALLSNMRPWKVICDNVDKIEKIFFNYDIYKVLEKIRQDGYQHFEDSIKSINCGNISIERQMRDLEYNLNLLLSWEKEHGSINEFYRSMTASELVKQLSKSDSLNKLRNMGESSVCEYLRFVGIDVPKPARHMFRIFGATRLGYSRKPLASKKEVFLIMDYFNKNTGKKRAYIDSLLWHYCSKGYGDICGSDPQCDKCDIRDYCNY